MKQQSYLEYSLDDGHIVTWLALGPCDLPVQRQPEPAEDAPAYRQRILAEQDRAHPDFDLPVEVSSLTCGKKTLYWQLRHSEPDHLLSWEGFLPEPTVRRAWAFCLLRSNQPAHAVLHLSATCPATLWLDGALAGQTDGPPPHATGEPGVDFTTTTCEVELGDEDTRVLVRLDAVGVRETYPAFTLTVTGALETDVVVRIPTLTPLTRITERQSIERTYSLAYLDRAVYTRTDAIRLMFPPGTQGSYQSVVRLQTPDRGIYGELSGHAAADSTIQGVSGTHLPSGEMRAVLMPPPEQYYDTHLRAERALPFWVAKEALVPEPAGTENDRLVELMREAARRGGVFGELARMALGWWSSVDAKTLRTAIQAVRERQAAERAGGCLPDLLGLIAIRARMANHERFPHDLLPELDEAIQSFNYALPERAGRLDTLDLTNEVNQILLHTCRILAGQLYPKARFSASGMTGTQEQRRGEKSAIFWLQDHGQIGFNLWHSQLDVLVMALTHLSDLATKAAVAELASVVLDKTLFTIAVHSFRGVFAPTRGFALPSYLRSGRFAPESAIGRLVWGAGSYEPDLRGAVSLGLAGKRYQPPELLRAIAGDRQFEVWARERQGSHEANTVSFRTNDFMLSSAQDYHPGQPGDHEHIWQATLSPEALVFTNHPRSFSQSADAPAGWWRGNAALPRVAQWRDTLVALYNAAEDAGLDFTHAYFPTFAFEEWHVPENQGHPKVGWAFARAGTAYLALYATRGQTLVSEGPDAYRELRSPGRQNVWLCQMGSQTTDENFETFQRRLMATEPTITQQGVEWTTIRGDVLEFAWTGPLRLNGSEQPITGFRHHESAFAIAEMPAERMDIGYGQQVMRLHFA